MVKKVPERFGTARIWMSREGRLCGEIKVDQGTVPQLEGIWSWRQQRYFNWSGMTYRRQWFEDLWTIVQRKEIVVECRGR